MSTSRSPRPAKTMRTFIGSDFVDEGKRVAEWLIKNANGKSKIIELEGTTGSSPANDARRVLTRRSTPPAASPSSLPGRATSPATRARPPGRGTAAARRIRTPTSSMPTMTRWRWAPSRRSRAAGKVPGKDVIVLSIDGGRGSPAGRGRRQDRRGGRVQPALRPKAFETMARFAKGETIEPG